VDAHRATRLPRPRSGRAPRSNERAWSSAFWSTRQAGGGHRIRSAWISPPEVRTDLAAVAAEIAELYSNVRLG